MPTAPAAKLRTGNINIGCGKKTKSSVNKYQGPRGTGPYGPLDICMDRSMGGLVHKRRGQQERSRERRASPPSSSFILPSSYHHYTSTTQDFRRCPSQPLPSPTLCPCLIWPFGDSDARIRMMIQDKKRVPFHSSAFPMQVQGKSCRSCIISSPFISPLG